MKISDLTIQQLMTNNYYAGVVINKPHWGNVVKKIKAQVSCPNCDKTNLSVIKEEHHRLGTFYKQLKGDFLIDTVDDIIKTESEYDGEYRSLFDLECEVFHYCPEDEEVIYVIKKEDYNKNLGFCPSCGNELKERQK